MPDCNSGVALCVVGCGQSLDLKAYKTEVTSVKLVLFKCVMSFETLTKVDQLTEILGFG